MVIFFGPSHRFRPDLLDTDNSDRMLDSLAALVLNSYLLGKRIGFQAEKIDQAILAKLTENIDKGHEIEKWYGDLSDLQRHLISKRR